MKTRLMSDTGNETRVLVAELTVRVASVLQTKVWGGVGVGMVWGRGRGGSPADRQLGGGAAEITNSPIGIPPPPYSCQWRQLRLTLGPGGRNPAD